MIPITVPHSKLNKTLNSQIYNLMHCHCPIIRRKEVIPPPGLLRRPCYDFTLVICPALDGSLHKVRPPALGITNSHGVTGGVYKTRERIHRGVLIRDY